MLTQVNGDEPGNYAATEVEEWRKCSRCKVINVAPCEEAIDVLLVEDSVSDAKLFERWLRESSLVKTIHVVPDGESALSLLQGEDPYADVPPPHLVLLDVNLPRMSGMEVLSAIKADGRFSEIPVVMMTSSVFESDQRQAHDLRVELFVPKPSDADEFTALVESLEKFWRRWSKRATPGADPEVPR